MKLIERYDEENLMKTGFTGAGMVIVSLLVLALIALGERVLYDLSHAFAGDIGQYGYIDNPSVIVVHAIFILSLLIISIVLNYVFGRRREKYAIALIPYFVTSMILAVQLAIELGVYFTNHHNNLQFYLVMTLLVLVSSYGIFHVQNNFHRSASRQVNHTALLVVSVVVFGIFALLILSFNQPKKEACLPGGYFQDSSVQGKGCVYPASNQGTQNYPNISQQTQQYAPASPPAPYTNPTPAPAPVPAQNVAGTHTNDNTPRIMYWYGKVNQHVANNEWLTDPDGVSGADINTLTYCRKWYPNTISVTPYKEETISTWYAAWNQGGYSATIMSYQCVQAQ
jgi:hypothetical protein